MSVAFGLGRILPVNYFGPIPGVAVGTTWKYRVQLSWAGVHRPHIAGIHGRANEGVYSLVLSNSSEDNIDSGTEILLTDGIAKKSLGVKSTLSKNSKINKALAMSCEARFNKKGAEALGNDWTKGKPIRVIRSHRASKYSKFAPKSGNRYDGIYKVVKYFPSRNKSGFIIWNYLLRRDDTAPAPWEKGGKEYPLNMVGVNGETDITKIEEGSSTKKSVAPFELSPELRNLIDRDIPNEKYWSQCIGAIKDGEREFLSKVFETFKCGICRDLLDNPVTLTCKHTFCMICMHGSFTNGIYFCPVCRQKINRNYRPRVNQNCNEALRGLFPEHSYSK